MQVPSFSNFFNLQKLYQTCMHSSRIRTARALTVFPGALPPVGKGSVTSEGGVTSERGVTSEGV